MIFSLLKINKKTSAVIASICIGIACLWGIALWQDLSPDQLFNLFLGSLVFIAAIILIAGLVIALILLFKKLFSIAFRPTDDQ